MKMGALKLVARFVEVGAPYENGCLSSKTRLALLERDVHPDFFEAAKYEVAKDIMLNPILRDIVEQYVSFASPFSTQNSMQLSAI